MICTCRDPLALGVVHRADAPCYIPEKRTWVGLTDEEVRKMCGSVPALKEAVREAEAKLKEKNAPADRNV